MRTRTTLLLLALAGILFGYLLLHERRQPRQDLAGWLLFDFEGDPVEDGSVHLEINPDEIAKIDVKRPADTLSFRQQKDTTWDMVRNVRDRASREVVGRLLSFCSQAKILDTVPAREIASGKTKASALGLDDAAAIRLTYRRADNERIVSLRIGRTAPLDGAMYVAVDDQRNRPDIYIVHPDIREFLAGPEEGFRDLWLAKYPAEEIVQFSVRQGEGEIEFTRAFADAATPPRDLRPGAAPAPERMALPWVISRPLPNARADQKAVNDLLAMISAEKLQSFVQAAAPTSPTQAAAGTDKPLLELTLRSLHSEDRKGATLAFYPDTAPESKFALCRDHDRKAEFRVDREFVDAIRELQDPNLMRDAHLCDLNPERINSILTSVPGGESAELYRVGDRWSVRRIGEEGYQVAAPEAVETMIRKLNESTVAYASDSLTDPAAFGFDKPLVSVTFGATVPPHASLDSLTPVTPANSRTLRLSLSGDGKVFANFSGESFVYIVEAAVPEIIPREMLKWRSRQLPSFPLRQLRMLRQTMSPAPSVEVEMGPDMTGWKAKRGDESVTALLDPRAAAAVGATLGSLEVNTWQSPSTTSQEALSHAAIQLDFQYEVMGGTEAVQSRTARLELAPMGGSEASPYYYGRHSEVPGIFLLNRKTVSTLIQPLVKVAPPDR